MDRFRSVLPGLDTLLLVGVVVIGALVVLSVVSSILALLRLILTIAVIGVAVAAYLRLRGRGA